MPDESSPRAQQIVARFQKAQGKIRTSWKSTLDELFFWMVPQYDPFQEKGRGEKRGEEIYDNTAVTAYQDAVGELQLSITPPDRDWVKLDIDPDAKAKMFPELRQTAGVRSDRIKAILAELDAQNRLTFEFIRKSNFDTEMHMAYQDVFASTGAIMVTENVEDPANPLLFRTVPVGQVFPEQGPTGLIDTVYREWKVIARNLPRLWPDGAWSEDVKRAIQEEPDSEVGIIEATIFDPDKGNWQYVVLESGEPHIAVEDTLDLSWWVVFRMTVMPGEIMGRGPAMTALPSVKSLNQYRKLMLQRGLWSVAGAWRTDDYSLMNLETLTIQPNMIIPIMPGATFEPLEQAGDFPITQEIINDLRQEVRETLLGINLPAPDGTVKTATEFAIRQQTALIRRGPPFARVYSELINPMYRRIRKVLMDTGHLKPIQGLDEQMVQVVAVSPIANQARRADAQEQLQVLITALQIAPEETRMAINVDAAITHFLAENDFPDFLFRSAEEQAEIEAAQAEVQAAQLQAEQQGTNGGVPGVPQPLGVG